MDSIVALGFLDETPRVADLEPTQSGLEVVGVTAGASTPNWLIEKVVEELESL